MPIAIVLGLGRKATISQLELVQMSIDAVRIIWEWLMVAQHCQNKYADKQ